jgi:hypothetical protein
MMPLFQRVVNWGGCARQNVGSFDALFEPSMTSVVRWRLMGLQGKVFEHEHEHEHEHARQDAEGRDMSPVHFLERRRLTVPAICFSKLRSKIFWF